MKLNQQTRSKLNALCQKYSKIMEPRELVGLYNDLDEFGVTIPAWNHWAKGRPHEFLINNEPVENSWFILSEYKFNSDCFNRIDYNCYFS